ncbi:MAG: hypothetical protein QXM89_04700 [Candidatus Bathyarchaeia archaeon]
MSLNNILNSLPEDLKSQLFERLLEILLKSKNVDKADPTHVVRFLYLAREGLLKSSECLKSMLYIATSMEKEETLSILSERVEFSKLRDAISG